jgi:hypothetical protein
MFLVKYFNFHPTYCVLKILFLFNRTTLVCIFMKPAVGKHETETLNFIQPKG